MTKFTRVQKEQDIDSFHFLPLSVEPFGLWHPTSASFIKSLAHKLAQRQNIPRGTACAQLYQRLSIALQHHSAEAILARRQYVDCAPDGKFLHNSPAMTS